MLIRSRPELTSWIALTFILFLWPPSLLGQSDITVDRSQITKLLRGLSDHSIKPSDALDPSLPPGDREGSLAYFEEPSYQLSLIPVAAIHISADGSASVPVKVEFKNANKEMATQTTVHFVKRNQVWYYANFDFLAFPTVIVVVIFICGVVGIAYASVVLVLRRRLIRQGKLDLANRLKIFIPIFWPRLLTRQNEK